VVRNAWTMPQERYNTDWVQEHGAGIVLDSFKDIEGGVSAIIMRLGEYGAGVARIRNRAIFEIPAILEGICVSAMPIRVGVDFIQHFRTRPVPASDPGSIRAAC